MLSVKLTLTQKHRKIAKTSEVATQNMANVSACDVLWTGWRQAVFSLFAALVCVVCPVVECVSVLAVQQTPLQIVRFSRSYP